MRIRTRSYAAAFAASAGVLSVTNMQQSSQALRSTSSPVRFSVPPLAWNSRNCDFNPRTSSTTNRKRTATKLCSSRTDADTEQDAKKIYGAPVVDSTLLRFISQQKKVPEVFREAAVVIEDGATVTEQSRQQTSKDDEQSTIENTETNSDSTYDSTTNVIKQKLTGRGSFVEETEDEMGFVYANNLAKTDPSLSTTSTTTTSWMAQFGSNNVAQIILANSDVTDEALAKTAGDAVERYCVVRNARQRIRRFLKERDNLWQSFTNTSRSELESLAAADVATSPSATNWLLDEAYDEVPSYGLEDVLAIMKEYGLSGNDICALLTHSPNLALRVPSQSFRKEETEDAETLEQTLQRSLNGLLLETLGMRKYDARKILRDCPGLLTIRGSKSAVEVVTIMTKLGVSTNSLANNKNKIHLPVLLSRSPAGLFRLVSFLSSTAVRMPLEQIGPLLRRREGQELMDALLPIPNTSRGSKSTVDAQSNTTVSEEASAAIDDAAATWSKTRMQRQETIERTYAGMTQTARILKAQIGTQDLTKVVAAYPNVLLLDARNQILPVSRYLMGGLGIWQKELSSVLQLYPTLLGTKIDDLERIVSYMLTLGVDEDDLAGIFRAFPALFCTKVEDMEAVVSYLKSIGVRDVGAFVTKLPSVLGFSVEQDLRPKWEFLKTVCLQPEFELKEFPAYFSYPFDRVIKTRFNYLAYKGISIRFVSMRIDTVLRFGDLDFATKVALDDDGGEAFAAFCNQRGSSSANGAAAQKAKRRKNNTRHKNRRKKARNRSNEANDLDDLNKIYNEGAPVRNKSLGNSLPSLKPTRPKRKPEQKKQQQEKKSQQTRNQQNPKQAKKKNNNNNNNPKPRKRGGDEDPLPSPA